MKQNKKLVGTTGEEIVADYLKKKKYKIIRQNYQCRFGEIDIIAADGEYTVFIEVKTRKDADYGEPSEAVNYFKKKKIIQMAKYYLMTQEKDIDIRFDVIEVFGEFCDGKFVPTRINHIENAFWE